MCHIKNIPHGPNSTLERFRWSYEALLHNPLSVCVFACILLDIKDKSLSVREHENKTYILLLFPASECFFEDATQLLWSHYVCY